MDKSSASQGTTDTPKRTRWDATPVVSRDLNAEIKKPQAPSIGAQDKTPVRMGATPSRFSETPYRPGQTPKNKWEDKTPVVGATPAGYIGMTPTPNQMKTPDVMNPTKLMELRYLKELQQRNRPYTDEELDMLLPGLDDGFEIIKPPESYKPQKNYSGPVFPGSDIQGYQMPDAASKPMAQMNLTPTQGDLPAIKPEEYAHFAKLLQNVNEEDLPIEEQKDRKILAFLLKIKNGTPQMRKSALRQLTLNARQFGPGPLFNQILPLLMSKTIEDQERHLLVKVVDRILYKLDELVRPYVHEILKVIAPMLIDQDYYARVEGRQIISNLAKAAGLSTMIMTMRPNIDHTEEAVRNTTARAFAVVASALGIGQLLPFLKAVCSSKKSWQARHTGIKIVQQIAILMGCSILPHLKSLVEIIHKGLKDEQRKVKIMTALALSALAEAAAPYGIEAFDLVLIALWEGINQHRDKSLGAFLKAIGFIIPLMEPHHANQYTKTIMPTLVKQFENPQEEMRKIVLKVIKQILSCEGVQASYVRQVILPDYFRQFWKRRMAVEKRNFKQLIETTVELAIKVGGAQIIQKIVGTLKDENESFRKMGMEAIEKIIEACGTSDMNHTLETQLVDGVIYAFYEQTTDDAIILNGFGTVINGLGIRSKQYFVQIIGTIQWRLNHKSIRVRQQAADLVAKIAHCMKICGQQNRLGRLGLNLNECLRQQFPQVLGSILGALKAIVVEVGMNKMTPPIKDLLPRLTPILKNRNEKVQENCIDLVGKIADKGSEEVSPKQWMRICFDLLEMLKAHKKSIRRATINTFGYIAKAIGPQDVLVTLLNNLKVQERQLRVCTTVAIAIVSQSCGPFTTIPALMNEYRVQELNVQNGVLKSFAFMFEYIGEMAKDYIYAITPLLEDALTDRDLVHRQTSAAAIKHLALGVQGFGCEDALVHLLNYVWPNIFETSPHVINAVMEAIEAMRVSLGPGIILLYIIQGLWHPARRVRQIYWRIYNMLYVGSQDSLVPFQPRIKDDGKNSFYQPELMSVL